MNAAIIFTKKELLESWRTHRLLILTVVFLIFGILSPLIAKLMPELLKGGLGGIKVAVPKPTSLDAIDPILQEHHPDGHIRVRPHAWRLCESGDSTRHTR